MTNKEISKWLMNLKNDIGETQYQPLWHYAEVIDMAIEALLKMDAKENYWIGCESCDRAMEDGECELWGDRMTEECGAWKERENDEQIH